MQAKAPRRIHYELCMCTVKPYPLFEDFVGFVISGGDVQIVAPDRQRHQTALSSESRQRTP
eukprot:2870970-Amphidinium_carterae.2